MKEPNVTRGETLTCRWNLKQKEKIDLCVSFIGAIQVFSPKRRWSALGYREQASSPVCMPETSISSPLPHTHTHKFSRKLSCHREDTKLSQVKVRVWRLLSTSDGAGSPHTLYGRAPKLPNRLFMSPFSPWHLPAPRPLPQGPILSCGIDGPGHQLVCRTSNTGPRPPATRNNPRTSERALRHSTCRPRQSTEFT